MKCMHTYSYIKAQRESHGAMAEETGGKAFVISFLLYESVFTGKIHLAAFLDKPTTCFSPHQYLLRYLPPSYFFVASTIHFLSSTQGRGEGETPREVTEIEDVSKKWSSAYVLRKGLCCSSLCLPYRSEGIWWEVIGGREGAESLHSHYLVWRRPGVGFFP